MGQIRIIFFDIDGTLVDPRTGKISSMTFQALQRLRERGMRLCICTGRAPSSLPDFDEMQFDAFCTFNGSLCYAGDQVIFSNPLPKEDVARVMENAAALGRPVTVATRRRLAANGYDDDLADYYRLADRELTVAEDFDQALCEDIYQIMLGCRAKDHPAIIQGAPGVKPAISWDRAVDIIPINSGKATAIAETLRFFGLTASEAMAFGDGQNDVTMLQSVGFGVAMGNAAEQLKAVADDVCGDVAQDGIYHYCLDHGLI